MKKGQFPAILPLASLNGQNGFKLDGENILDSSGYLVSTVGDINSDGYTDLLIGAPGYPGNNLTGRGYVVFGGLGVGSSGMLNLSSLNGVNGFKLDGENNKDYSSHSGSAAGDINGDGVADFLIGAFAYPGDNRKGRTYVVFGGSEVGSSGTMALSSLNGTNGFKLDGENNGDLSGISVSAIGDINGDGHNDLLIGAEAYPKNNNRRGRSYVVFGGPGVGSSGLLNLSSLNGSNGFKLDGENNNDYSGWSVSAAGDINSDGRMDLLIVAIYLSGQGRSYVVFGGPGVGNSGVLALSGLNGTNGFKLDGENNNDYSGQSVSVAGDINNDGYTDLLVGAYGYPKGNNTGRSYVVFGGLGVGSSGILALSSLNGVNGFKLDGENKDDYSGHSVDNAGDINGDGVTDLLIGAHGYKFARGRSYVVFGGAGVGSSGILALSSLNGVNGFKLDGENGADSSGYSVSAAGDINGDGVADLLIGAPNYSSNSNPNGRSYVVFGDVPPVLVNNSLSLSVGAAIQLNSTYLAAYDRNHNNNTLIFVPTALSHGYFATISTPNIPIVNFTQQQVVSGTIQFVHDGSLVAPSYNITVRSTGIAWTGPLSAKINFIGAPQSYFPAILPLASLNGQNGFKLDGEAMGDYSGWSVSAAGDINGDGTADLLIGAIYPVNQTGRSYVVFGGSGVGGSGLIALSGLNGSNGFKLDGEAIGDQSGRSVSATGDINGDGFADLLVWAPFHASNIGRGYVVFGGPGVGGSGLIALSGLNGSNGFKLDGESINDYSGQSVSIAGDVNGDGVSDLLIGAYGHGGQMGRSYVVFGGPGINGSGLIALSGLNGSNGFKLDGEANDQSGFSVSAAGDINGDGFADLLIGAYGYASYTGRSYVVLGGPGVGSSGLVALSGLNGSNGFKLDGETTSDGCGQSVSVAGDINGDGFADLLIGARYHASSMMGRSYVVLGGTGIGGSGLIALSGLNGSNGFKLDGEMANDQSGWSVSATGDINGDGFADLLIGAPLHVSGTGRSYVVLGGRGVGGSGLVALSGLNGGNGFKLDGDWNDHDQSGFSVSPVGDINGDGVDDLLIGAPFHAAYTGRTYVVFGDIPPTLVQNHLTLSSGSKVFLNSTFLSAYDRNHNNNTLVFTPTGVTHGHFELVSQPGIALANFTQPQLLNGTVRFVHDGSMIAPSYNITVRSAGIAWTGPAPANITFISPNSTSVSTSTSKSSTSVSTPTPFVSQTVTPSTAQTSTPAVTTSSTPSITPTPTFISAPPVLLNNQLTLSNAQTLILSSNNLQASEVGFNNSQLIFIVGNVQNGYFATVPSSNNPSKNLTSFTQAQIQSGDVEFVLTGNNQAPSYSVLVSDGRQSTVPSLVKVSFVGAPIITQNKLNITTGGTITLTPTMLNVTVTDGSTPSQVMITVSNLQHATITTTLTGMPVNNFTLTDLQVGDIQLTQDGSLITPSYTITVHSTQASSAPNLTTVYFSNQGVYAPQLVNNYLQVTQGQATVLSNRYLSAMQLNGQGLDNNTTFYISEISHGHFSVLNQPQVWISSFTQGQLSSGQVQFVQDGSLSIPGYNSAVKAFGLQSASLSASIFFTPVNVPSPSPSPPPPVSNNSNATTIIAIAITSGVVALAALFCGAWFYRKKRKDTAETMARTALEMQPASSYASPTSSLSVTVPEKSAVGTLSDLKLSQRSDTATTAPLLIDEKGEMKISLNITYQDLEFDEKDKLGSGAFGTVYKGTYKFNQVAIKQLHAQQLSEAAVDELKLEAGILGSMRSNYIVQLQGICLEAPHYCLVMELMPKGSLYSVLQNSPQLPLSVRYQIGLDVCYGLYHLHDKNILHRDLKSLNVLLDDRFRAKISDFGLSKIKSEMGSASSSKGMKGTLGWMAPELFEEKPQVTAAADIYAFGMVLWEMMVNPYRIPFQDLAPASLLSAKVKRGEKQETIPETCPPELAQVIRACWQEPDKRPSAKVLAKSLSSIFKSSQEQPAKESMQSLQKDQVVQKDDLLTAAF